MAQWFPHLLGQLLVVVDEAAETPSRTVQELSVVWEAASEHSYLQLPCVMEVLIAISNQEIQTL
jgi:hypothetical protein